jgi:hypothetical protein
MSSASGNKIYDLQNRLLHGPKEEVAERGEDFRDLGERLRNPPLLTRFAGVWLLVPVLLVIFPIIRRLFGKERLGNRCVLTLFACAFVGIARVFHLPDIQDPGLALFSGGRTVENRCHRTEQNLFTETAVWA